MAGKISTLILTVDLQCYICTKKIKKTIFKLPAREQIQTVSYDEKNNTITISGLFDPQKLKKKLLCKACKEIKEIKIKEEEKKPPAQKETKPPEPEKEKPKPPTVQEWPPVWLVGPPLPSCCCRPYYGGCRFCTCGMFYGCTAPPLPPAVGPSTSTCQFFYEDDPWCTIM